MNSGSSVAASLALLSENGDTNVELSILERLLENSLGIGKLTSESSNQVQDWLNQIPMPTCPYQKRTSLLCSTNRAIQTYLQVRLAPVAQESVPWSYSVAVVAVGLHFELPRVQTYNSD